MSGAAIDVQGVSRRYARRWALSDVTFQVPSGAVMILRGSNGAGKSTLLRVLATAIRPDRGRASVGGFDVASQREDVRKLMAMLSHENYLYSSLTARENLEVVADHMPASRASIGALLERVALGARAGDLVSTFSAGMRKRLSFARVLLQQPKVALLDEPYGALDPPGFALVDEVVRELRNRGTTVVMATHQWERAATLGDVTVTLEQGRLVGLSSELSGSQVVRLPGQAASPDNRTTGQPDNPATQPDNPTTQLRGDGL